MTWSVDMTNFTEHIDKNKKNLYILYMYVSFACVWIKLEIIGWVYTIIIKTSVEKFKIYIYFNVLFYIFIIFMFTMFQLNTAFSNLLFL